MLGHAIEGTDGLTAVRSIRHISCVMLRHAIEGTDGLNAVRSIRHISCVILYGFRLPVHERSQERFYTS